MEFLAALAAATTGGIVPRRQARGQALAVATSADPSWQRAHLNRRSWPNAGPSVKESEHRLPCWPQSLPLKIRPFGIAFSRTRPLQGRTWGTSGTCRNQVPLSFVTSQESPPYPVSEHSLPLIGISLKISVDQRRLAFPPFLAGISTGRNMGSLCQSSLSVQINARGGRCVALRLKAGTIATVQKSWRVGTQKCRMKACLLPRGRVGQAVQAGAVAPVARSASDQPLEIQPYRGDCTPPRQGHFAQKPPWRRRKKSGIPGNNRGRSLLCHLQSL